MFGNHLKQIAKLAEKKNADKIAQYANDKHLDTRLAALDALGQCGKNENGYNALVSAVHDPNAQVRAHAILALAQVGDPKARAHIEHQASKETDPQVNAAITQALKLIHGKED